MKRNEVQYDPVICFCAGITRSEIGRAVDAGATTIREVRDITSKHASGDCAVKNPSGRCCGAIFKQEIENFRNKNSGKR